MVNKIKFDCNYPKLCNQAHAKLVWIDEIRDCDFILKYPHLKALFEYDTKPVTYTHLDVYKRQDCNLMLSVSLLAC